MDCYAMGYGILFWVFHGQAFRRFILKACLIKGCKFNEPSPLQCSVEQKGPGGNNVQRAVGGGRLHCGQIPSHDTVTVLSHLTLYCTVLYCTVLYCGWREASLWPDYPVTIQSRYCHTSTATLWLICQAQGEYSIICKLGAVIIPQHVLYTLTVEV